MHLLSLPETISNVQVNFIVMSAPMFSTKFLAIIFYFLYLRNKNNIIICFHNRIEKKIEWKNGSRKNLIKIKTKIIF
jgi:hypothetical protein